MSQDPFVDPRFPDRPQTPDYWRIVEVVNQQDGRYTEDGQEMPQIVADIVDEKAVTYMAMNRALMVQKLAGAAQPDDTLTQVLASVWVDAFTAGVRFEKAGGHRDA